MRGLFFLLALVFFSCTDKARINELERQVVDMQQMIDSLSKIAEAQQKLAEAAEYASKDRLVIASIKADSLRDANAAKNGDRFIRICLGKTEASIFTFLENSQEDLSLHGIRLVKSWRKSTSLELVNGSQKLKLEPDLPQADLDSILNEFYGKIL